MVLKNAGLSSYFFWGYGCRTVRTHMERVFLRSLLTYGVSPCLQRHQPILLLGCVRDQAVEISVRDVSAQYARKPRRLDVAAQLGLKAEFESGPTYFSFKRLVPAAFKFGCIGSTCTALP
jgi:hypothetical protein